VPSPAYFVDVSRDPNNVLFGRPYRLDVPRYYMAARSARGLPPRVVLRVVDGAYVGVQADASGDTARGGERYFGAQRVARDSDASLRRVKYATDGSVLRAPAPLLPFVPVGRQRASARSTAANPTSADSDDEAEGETLSELLFRRAKEFNERLRANPHDIDGWLAFAAFQDQFVAVQGRPPPGAADEKRISIFQVSKTKTDRFNSIQFNSIQSICTDFQKSALRENGDDERLLLAYLQVCERRWDAVALEQLWRKFLAQFPDSAHVWLS
jgi:hypothetical protein